MALTAITLENFRAFSKPTRFELRPITLLVGPNNSGKSSVTKALSLLRATAESGDWNRLAFTDGDHRLGSFERVHNRQQGDDALTLRLDFKAAAAKGDHPLDMQTQSLCLTYDNQALRSFSLFDHGHEILTAERVHFKQELEEEEGTATMDFPAWEYRGFFRIPEDDLEAGYMETVVCRRLLGSVSPESRSAFAALWPPDVWERLSRILAAPVPISSQLTDDSGGPLEFIEPFVTTSTPHDVPDVLMSMAKVLRAVLVLRLGEVDGAGSREEQLARLFVDHYVYPLLDGLRARMTQEVASERVVTVRASDPLPPAFLPDTDDTRFAHLLRRYADHSWNPLAELDGILSDATGQKETQWLSYFGIGDALEVERAADSGYVAWVGRSDWMHGVQTLPMVEGEFEQLDRLLAGDPMTSEEEEEWKAQVENRRQARDEALRQRRERSPRDGRLRLADLGTGYSRLVRLLLEANEAPSEFGLLVLEEPESNLHPDLQSRLADLFVAMVQREQRLLVETHSEYLIRKLQYLVATGKANSKDIVIYYLGPHPTAEDHVREITLDKAGMLSQPFGPGFFDEAANLMVDLYKYQSSN